MGDYLSEPRKKRDKKVPESPSIDEEALVTKITKGILDNLQINITQNITGSQDSKSKVDSFDDTKSLEALAQSMTTQRGVNKANFEDLGRVKETDRGKEQIEQAEKTIDLLKNIDD